MTRKVGVGQSDISRAVKACKGESLPIYGVKLTASGDCILITQPLKDDIALTPEQAIEHDNQQLFLKVRKALREDDKPPVTK